MVFRILIFTGLAVVCTFGQTASQPKTDTKTPAAITEKSSAEPAGSDGLFRADLNDPGVVQAQQELDRIRGLVGQGVLPPVNLSKAQMTLDEAKDNSILRQGAFSSDITPEQADQIVVITSRLAARKELAAAELRRLASSGAIARVEAEASEVELAHLKVEMALAQQRVLFARQVAEALRTQKNLAQMEIDMDSHPEWAGSVFIRYDGSGNFSRDDFDRISLAYRTKFLKTMPVSADGSTAVHRSMGFNHTGRVDVALQPDTEEGQWLMGYLKARGIPYIAFRQAVAHQATGPHIHIGPRSTRLAMAR